jgi:hypothetical protein
MTSDKLVLEEELPMVCGGTRLRFRTAGASLFVELSSTGVVSVVLN